METCYKIPDWASKLPIGLHLEILKENKVVQKLLIDEKKSYQSGRTVETNDIKILPDRSGKQSSGAFSAERTEEEVCQGSVAWTSKGFNFNIH
ncbi:unnamed protein product [Leptidea sinapis]|uniref:Uncharacterized protein n=1 Tax=Leptidea sinapis TaxID=189913 RepID=A0A5E4PXD4_9NEOP|nr:unnamed protein product [Leptidea sinapis]